MRVAGRQLGRSEQPRRIRKRSACAQRFSSLPHESALRCYFTPDGAELPVCPSEEYVSPNLLAVLKNVVLVSGYDYCHVAIDSHAPRYGLNLSIFDATRHQIIDLIILRTDDARRSNQRVVVCVNLSERRSVSVTQSFHASIIGREYRTPCFVGVTCAPCIVARGVTESGERSGNQYHHS